MRFRTKLIAVSMFLSLTACPSTKNSSDVDQKNAFPSFHVSYSANSKVTTAYAQVWEDQKRRTTLRLTGSASLSFEDSGMDLHDGEEGNGWYEGMSGTYYRRSVYDLPAQAAYKFKWDKGDGTSTLEALVNGAAAPKLLSPAASSTFKRQEGIRIKIEPAGYQAQDETLAVAIEDERGNRIDSNDSFYLPLVGSGEYFLAGDKSWSLEAGEIFVTITREVKTTERSSSGEILFETKSSFEAGKVPLTLVDD